jgi:hypothetical protein
LPSGVAPYTVTASTRADAADCTTGWNWYQGPGATLNVGSSTNTCSNHVGGYNKVFMGNVFRDDWDWNVNNVICSVPYCEINVQTIGSATYNKIDGIHAYDMNTSSWDTNPEIFKVVSLVGQGRIDAGEGGSTVSVTGNNSGQIFGGAVNDTFIVGGSLTTEADNNDSEILGWQGNDTFYVNVITNVGGAVTRVRGNYWNDDDPYGNDTIYFNEITGGSSSGTAGCPGCANVILGMDGNDTIICTGFSGGADATHVNWNPSRATCTGVKERSEVKGGNGNDRIFIDGPYIQTAATNGNQEINGDLGNNIIYVKSIADNSNYYSWVNGSTSTTGGSLIILGGNITQSGSDNVWIESYGNNNVLLVKSGVTISGNIMVSNGPGTDTSSSIVYNGSQTSSINFPRILRY